MSARTSTTRRVHIIDSNRIECDEICTFLRRCDSCFGRTIDAESQRMVSSLEGATRSGRAPSSPMWRRPSRIACDSPRAPKRSIRAPFRTPSDRTWATRSSRSHYRRGRRPRRGSAIAGHTQRMEQAIFRPPPSGGSHVDGASESDCAGVHTTLRSAHEHLPDVFENDARAVVFYFVHYHAARIHKPLGVNRRWEISWSLAEMAGPFKLRHRRPAGW